MNIILKIPGRRKELKVKCKPNLKVVSITVDV